MTGEIRYVDDPWEDEETGYSGRRPKWMSPSTPFQKQVLAAAHRKYWPDKTTRSRFVMIEKAMQPMRHVMTPEMPEEWVKNCLQWFKNKNKKGFIPLKGLLTLINNEDRKSDFIRKNRSSILQEEEIDDDDPYA
jgi:hypothetical protein